MHGRASMSTSFSLSNSLGKKKLSPKRTLHKRGTTPLSNLPRQWKASSKKLVFKRVATFVCWGPVARLSKTYSICTGYQIRALEHPSSWWLGRHTLNQSRQLRLKVSSYGTQKTQKTNVRSSTKPAASIVLLLSRSLQMAAESTSLSSKRWQTCLRST